MKKTTYFSDKKIEYSIDRGKRKHLYIQISRGEVLIKAPKRISDSDIEKAVINKGKWILDKLKSVKNNLQKPKEYKSDEIFHILGNPYYLRIDYAKNKRIIVHKDNINIYVVLPESFKETPNPDKLKEAVENFYKKLAAIEINESFERMTALTGLKPNKITVKKLKRTWGRCSCSGNISISRNLIKYQKAVIDYVVLHELCHLKHFNHSKDFWKMVEFYMPHYKKYYTELKSLVL